MSINVFINILNTILDEYTFNLRMLLCDKKIAIDIPCFNHDNLHIQFYHILRESILIKINQTFSVSNSVATLLKREPVKSDIMFRNK
jgi:hypothetical protein